MSSTHRCATRMATKGEGDEDEPSFAKGSGGLFKWAAVSVRAPDGSDEWVGDGVEMECLSARRMRR